MKRFDAIVIGAGQAGPSLTGRLTAAGMTVAVIERKLGTGCSPLATTLSCRWIGMAARR